MHAGLCLIKALNFCLKELQKAKCSHLRFVMMTTYVIIFCGTLRMSIRWCTLDLPKAAGTGGKSYCSV
jgi:hypothetical protein